MVEQGSNIYWGITLILIMLVDALLEFLNSVDIVIWVKFMYWRRLSFRCRAKVHHRWRLSMLNSVFVTRYHLVAGYVFSLIFLWWIKQASGLDLRTINLSFIVFFSYYLLVLRKITCALRTSRSTILLVRFPEWLDIHFRNTLMALSIVHLHHLC